MRKIIKLTITFMSLTAIGGFVIFSGQSSTSAAVTRHIVFPVVGPSSYSNDFTAPRGDRQHNAIDIIANKGQKLVAAVAGTIIDVQYPQPSWGYSVTIRDSDGYRYTYIHMNDDNPGTNDGKGGGYRAYGPDVKEGNKVVRGQLLGYNGDSGKSNGIPHLHFEMRSPTGKILNPYSSLRIATKISSPKNYPALSNELLPSGTSFKSKVSVDLGNFDGDSDDETLTAPGEGGRVVKVFDTDKQFMYGFMPNTPGFYGGVDVAAGNFDGDAMSEIVTGSGKGGKYVKVFEADGTLLSTFAPYGPNFRQGIFVAAGDVDDDGRDEIITGPAKGGGPRMSVFELDGTRIASFYVLREGFKGGIDVASGDVDDDGVDEIVTAAGPGGGPHVITWRLNQEVVNDFYPYSRSFRGGVRVSAGNIRTGSDNDEIITVAMHKGQPILRMFNENASLLDEEHFMEQWWRGYHDIGAGNGRSTAATGYNRRDSLRNGL